MVLMGEEASIYSEKRSSEEEGMRENYAKHSDLSK